MREVIVGGLVFLVVGAAFAVREWFMARSRERVDAAIASFNRAKEKRDAEIDADKTPKPRTEQEIRDELKTRHGDGRTHRTVR